MIEADNVVKEQTIQTTMHSILDEHQQLVKNVAFDTMMPAIPLIKQANHIFLTGAGRTGFMIKAVAMRLMHLGYSVYVVGETTTPAIGKGDLLIAASGSGTTSSIVKAAETAYKNNANVICFTTNTSSPLAQLASQTIQIPAAGKQERNEIVSKQYAGSLFEQAFLLISDALIHFLWKQDGKTIEELWNRHANME